MKGDLLKISLDEQDQPVIEFTHKETGSDLEQKLLGAFIRQISRQGVELHLVKKYADSNDKPLWDYQIRPKRDDTDEAEPATTH